MDNSWYRFSKNFFSKFYFIIKIFRGKNKLNKKNIKFTIAVDGGSASGKTTGSKLIAKKFNFKLLSSGKLYRYLAYRIISNKEKYNKKFILNLSKKISLKKLNIKKLYSPEVTNLSSVIAKKKFVRIALRKFQIESQVMLIACSNEVNSANNSFRITLPRFRPQEWNLERNSALPRIST